MNKPIKQLPDPGDFYLCDAPGCKKAARHEQTIFDEDGEDQGREMLCNAHFNY